MLKVSGKNLQEMNKVIPIRTDSSKFYRQFLEVLRSVPPISKLRPRELEVLAELLYQNNRYGDLDENVRYTMIFSTSVRKEMRLNINIGEESFNNNLSILRKYGIVKDNKLNSFFDTIVFDDNYSLEFKFKSVK